MVLLTAACLLTVLTAHARADGGSDDGWIVGRSTWYDDSPWMSVHTGSCRYGYLGDRFGGPQNWHVGAMNDGNSMYSGSCGKCFEPPATWNRAQIVCVPMTFHDNYGNVINREGDCHSLEPVVITITDTCPCVKPNNVYSNKRWCCGDMNHFDIGVWAFEKMADPGKGVIGIKYRPVDCTTAPSGSSHGPPPSASHAASTMASPHSASSPVPTSPASKPLPVPSPVPSSPASKPLPAPSSVSSSQAAKPLPVSSPVPSSQASSPVPSSGKGAPANVGKSGPTPGSAGKPGAVVAMGGKADGR